MINELRGTATDGSAFSATVTSIDGAPRVLGIRQVVVDGPGYKCLGFELRTTLAGEQVQEKEGEVAMNFLLEFNSGGTKRRANDVVYMTNGQLWPEWMQMRTETPADVPFADIALEFRLIASGN